MFNNARSARQPATIAESPPLFPRPADASPHPPAKPAPPKLPEAEHNTRLDNHSIIDACLTMRGELESEGDILVRGRVFGNIKCRLLIIDEAASVEGDVVAEEVVLRGAAKGKLRAGRVRIESTADVHCEICHKTFSAEEGARIRGALSLDGEDAGGGDVPANSLDARLLGHETKPLSAAPLPVMTGGAARAAATRAEIDEG